MWGVTPIPRTPRTTRATSVGQGPLFRNGMGFDDRNICYLAYTSYGWGMVMDDPALADGGWMPNITLATTPPTIGQFLPGAGDLSPFSLVNVKTSDGSYYVLV